MYAIIRTGGKQYKVKAGDIVRVEKLRRDLGSEIDLTDILLIGGEKTFVGEPTVANAKVTAVVTNQSKLPKVIVFKKKRRQGYRRMHGHRQLYTELFIKEITSPEGEISKADKEAPVFDPNKKEAKQKQMAEAKKASKKEGTSVKKKTQKKAAAKKTKAKKKTKARKKTAKKAAGKKKSGGAKKKTAKKTAAKKKATKKKS